MLYETILDREALNLLQEYCSHRFPLKERITWKKVKENILKNVNLKKL